MSSALQLNAFTDLLGGVREARRIVEIDLDELLVSPVQVRAPFDSQNNEDDAGLVESVRQDGVIQPLLVVLRAEGGSYQIIDGHRRVAAARQAGLTTVPCIVLTLDQVEAAVQTGISNLQRLDLTPLEEGRQYVALMRISGLSAQGLAQRLGKSPRHVQRRVSLTQLPPRVQQLLEQNRLSAYQAMGCQDEAWGPAIAELAAEMEMSRGEIDGAMAYLRAHPGATPQEAVGALMKGRDRASDLESAATDSLVVKVKEPKDVIDYPALVAALDLDLSQEQKGLLAEYANLEQLAPYAVRWAGLVLTSLPTVTTAAAVAYAGQLSDTPVGRALRAIDSSLEALERRTQKSRQLTPNTAVAVRHIISDFMSRMTNVSTALERAVGLNCAGAMSNSHNHSHTKEEE